MAGAPPAVSARGLRGPPGGQLPFATLSRRPIGNAARHRRGFGAPRHENAAVPEPIGEAVRVLDLPTLIRTKRAAGRPREFEAVAELEALEEEQSSRD